jgi:hypothetical protein
MSAAPAWDGLARMVDRLIGGPEGRNVAAFDALARHDGVRCGRLNEKT